MSLAMQAAQGVWVSDDFSRKARSTRLSPLFMAPRGPVPPVLWCGQSVSSFVPWSPVDPFYAPREEGLSYYLFFATIKNWFGVQLCSCLYIFLSVLARVGMRLWRWWSLGSTSSLLSLFFVLVSFSHQFDGAWHYHSLRARRVGLNLHINTVAALCSALAS